MQLIASIVSTLPGGGPAVSSAGSKGSLRPRVSEARKYLIAAAYLRDRDFDSDPPATLHELTVDTTAQGTALGWRWCRHEIENYLLEPEIVARATGWDQADFTDKLVGAARSLRHYTAARWAVGTARRSLPPLYELCTRPEDLKHEIQVAHDLSEQASRDWASRYVGAFRHKVQQELADAALLSTFDRWSARLDAIDATEKVLVYHGGKDLLAALAPALSRRASLKHPVEFRNALRDWIVVHPTQALTLLPEWTELLRRIG